MDIRKKIGLRNIELRLENKLPQESLSFKASIDKTYVNEVENGKRNISVINLEKIITTLGKDFNSFFDMTSFLKTNDISKN